MKIFWIALIFFFGKSSANRNSFQRESVDLTLTPGATGKEVAEACVQKINSLVEFDNDFQLLKRIALVGSNFGENYTSGTADRGMWQISSDVERAVGKISKEKIYILQVEALQSLFTTNSMDFSKLDFTVPLQAAAAVRLFIDATVVNSSSIQTIDEQANWWNVVFNRGFSPANFSSIVNAYVSSSACNNFRLDLWFCVDGSASVSKTEFYSSLNFIKTVSQRLVIGPNNVRIGLSVYNIKETIFLSFSAEQNNTHFERVIDSISFTPRGNSLIGQLITDIVETGFSNTAGAWPLSDSLPRVLVILTDGMSDDNVAEPAEMAHRNGIEIFAIGVGQNIDSIQLNTIASNPDTSHVYHLDGSVATASAISFQLVECLCLASIKIPPETAINANISPGSTQYFTFQTNQSRSTTLSCSPSSTSVESNGVIYISTFPHPSAALHDIMSPINLLQEINISVDAASISNPNIMEVYVAVNCDLNEPNNLAFTITLTHSFAPEKSVFDLNKTTINNQTGTIIGIVVVGSFIAILVVTIAAFCIFKKLNVKNIVPYGVTENDSEDLQDVENALQISLLKANLFDKVDLKFIMNLQNLINAAELLNFSSTFLIQAQMAHQGLMNKLNEVNQLKINLQAVLRIGEVDKIHSILASTYSLYYLNKWKSNDLELKLLLNKCQVVAHQNMGSAEERLAKKLQARQSLISTLENPSSKRFDYRLSTFIFEISLPKFIKERSLEDLALLDNAKSILLKISQIELRKQLSQAFIQKDIVDLTSALESIEYAIQDGSLSILDPEFQNKISDARCVLTKLQEANIAKIKLLKLDQFQINEIKCYDIPSKAVRSVMKATLILLGENSANLDNWNFIQTQIGERGKNSLKRRIFSCDARRISTVQAEEASSYIKNLTMSEVATQSRAASVFFDWICFIKRYFKCKSMLRSIEVQDTKVGPPPKIAENHPIKESKSFDSLSGDCVTLHPESDSIPYKI